MRIFVYEHITGGGLLDQALPARLAREGGVMLTALLRDLADIPDVEIITSRDPRLPALNQPAKVLVPQNAEEAAFVFRDGVAMADAVWPIAPETAGVLERLSRTVLEQDKILLGSHPEAVRLAASKLATSRRLARHGISAVPTHAVTDRISDTAEGWVVKPDDGAGCGDTHWFSTLQAAQHWLSRATGAEHYVLQPFIPGKALSLSLLCRAGQAFLLSCNCQRIVIEDDSFHFLGSQVNAAPDSQGAFADLAQRVTAAIPGLWGYVGIDLVQSGTGVVVMEVNPRLTTSYAGLHQALNCNPAALVLRLLDERSPLRLPEFSASRVDVEIEAAHAV
ncbi:MAG TPA: ATP-grasp domain-containing protein [Burkholderiales bacterium]|nr:ATP-grasp domain-containing protein [Burkholderiales bacterium]